MGIKTSNDAHASTVKEFKNYTGVIPYKVVAVNPNLAELKSIGVDYLTQEPEYSTSVEFDGKVINKEVSFYEDRNYHRTMYEENLCKVHLD